MDKIENENEEEIVLDFDDVQVDDYEEPNNDGIDKNYEIIEINPDENIKQKIFEGIDEKDRTEKLMNKALSFYKLYELNKIDNGIDIMKSILSEALEFSNYNLSDRLFNFFDFVLLSKDLKLEAINKALKIKVKDLEKDNNKDIIFFWKQIISEEYLKSQKIIIDSEEMKDCIRLLLEHNFNLNQIYIIFSPFLNVIINKKHPQFETIKTIVNTIIFYPNYLEENKEEKKNGENTKEEEMKEFINSYIEEVITKNEDNENEIEYVFDKKKNVALDFYLKVSSDKDNNKSLELTIPEIFQYLKINNPGISDMKIKRIEEQLKIIQNITNDSRYKNYEKKDFQNWAKNEVPQLEFDKDNSDRSTAIILGMISLAIKKSRELNKLKGYLLRNTQLIAILLFISKEKNKGLIEEISTGEGKSSIICSLSIYYALLKHKVDVISSSYTLAQRDSEGFKFLYSFFNLTTNYPFDSKPEPYIADILYGTFFEFEGDYLRDITSNNKIRNNRPYDVIIIDEVDNLFIDNIFSSTRLTHSSRGFKFLIPIYLTIYIIFELFDYFFLLFFKIGLENLEDGESKEKFEEIINNPRKRKKEIINIINGDFKELFQFGKKINQNNLENNKIKIDEKIEEAGNEYIKFISKIKKCMEFPDFLESFAGEAVQYWCDSAYDAKNLMEIDRDYVEVINREGNRDISPVDRTNTGETQLSTVYSRGLHQMLEIKHKFRVKDETLVHTFLSHITFFRKYKNENEFLFFGLTGTIGDKETQKIYKSKYFDSDLLFIPQYKKKRFVELPPLLVNYKDHFKVLCKDIIINFYKGRKILVICSSIKEAKILEEELKKNINIKDFGIKDKIIEKEDYKESIILYTRSDTEQANITKKNKRIILSTNLGGRGTDIKTNELEEEAGGLHVILTYMPNNYRVLKQAFGRTSREGKKGTGQIILRDDGNATYAILKNEMVENEKKEISYIKKNLRIVLFKDKLFEDFVKIIRRLDFRGFLIEDIKEKWAQFLRTNISSNTDKDELNTEEVQKKYDEFKKKIMILLLKGENYEKFENPFYKMQEGLRLHLDYDKELMNYYDFDVKQTKFYFTQPYIKAVIKIINTENYNDKFFKEVTGELEETVKRIDLLIEENINPVLLSFEQWESALSNFEKTLEIDHYMNDIVDINKPFADKSFSESDLCKQYTNIKNICNKIKDRIAENKSFIKNFQDEYKKDKALQILVTEEELAEGLSLNEEEMKEEEFFHDSSFLCVYKFSKIKKMSLKTSFGLLVLLGICFFGAGIYSAVIAGIGAFYYFSLRIVAHIGHKSFQGREIGSDSLFGNLFYLVAKSSNKNRNMKKKIFTEQNFDTTSKLKKNTKSILFEKIIENVEIIFEKIKKSANILNFLIFVDTYYSENIWEKKIKQIFIDKFNNVYKTNFISDNFFKTHISNDTMETHLNKYNQLFNTYLDECIKEIIKLGNAKKFDKKDGINCLEHLIIDLNSDKISENLGDIIVQKMLECRLISQDGRINQRLFEDCFITKDGQTLEQNINIHVINKIINKKTIKKIKDLKEFQIKKVDIPLVNSSYIDLANFYQIKGYNAQEHLEKDFSLYIINSFKKIIIKLLTIKSEVYENYYNNFLNVVKNLVKNLLQEKIFTKYSKSSFENVISTQLSNEEKVQFNKLIENAKENIKNLVKK